MACTDVNVFYGDKHAIKHVDLDESILSERRRRWQRPASSVKTGLLAKYRAEVLSASEGAVTVAPAWD